MLISELVLKNTASTFALFKSRPLAAKRPSVDSITSLSSEMKLDESTASRELSFAQRQFGSQRYLYFYERT